MSWGRAGAETPSWPPAWSGVLPNAIVLFPRLAGARLRETAGRAGGSRGEGGDSLRRSTWGSLASWVLAVPSGDEDWKPVTVHVAGAGPSVCEQSHLPQPCQAGTPVPISQTWTLRLNRWPRAPRTWPAEQGPLQAGDSHADALTTVTRVHLPSTVHPPRAQGLVGGRSPARRAVLYSQLQSPPPRWLQRYRGWVCVRVRAQGILGLLTRCALSALPSTSPPRWVWWPVGMSTPWFVRLSVGPVSSASLPVRPGRGCDPHVRRALGHPGQAAALPEPVRSLVGCGITLLNWQCVCDI